MNASEMARGECCEAARFETIAAAWEVYRAGHLSADIRPDELRCAKRAFYSGAGAVLDLVAATVSPADVGVSGAIAACMELDGEVETFIHSREAWGD